jgi:LytR cell envelope-related transcriptional attenuator
MQTTERPTGPSRNQSPARGVVLVAVAVVLGFFVLRAMHNTSAPLPNAATGAGTTTATTAAPGGAGKATGTTAAKTARPPGQVTVVVANASGVKGAAAKQTNSLKAAGYKTGAAGNGPKGLSLTQTQVLAAPGYEAEAHNLAFLLGKPNAVKPIGNPPPVPLNGANILILLGADLAQG